VAVLENAVPDGNGNVVVTGEIFRQLWVALGCPDFPDNASAIFGGMEAVTTHCVTPEEVAQLRAAWGAGWDAERMEEYDGYGERPD
jgi:hypothetical protein